MTSLVILCRHGNTFRKGEKVVMVGSRDDLPLTEEGLSQADAVIAALARRELNPVQILAGPLQRTRVFAERIKEALSPAAAYSVDSRLTELDYGAWNGLSDEEISAQFGAQALREWRDKGIRPSATTFHPPESTVREESAALLAELSAVSGISLVVSSNGRLRELGRIVRGDASTNSESHAVSTGSLCVVVHEEGTGWRVLGWNLKPAQLDALDLGTIFRSERSSRRS